jgi:hypothetical protein
LTLIQINNGEKKKSDILMWTGSKAFNIGGLVGITGGDIFDI